jgi:hypothetical protein
VWCAPRVPARPIAMGPVPWCLARATRGRVPRNGMFGGVYRRTARARATPGPWAPPSRSARRRHGWVEGQRLSARVPERVGDTRPSDAGAERLGAPRDRPPHGHYDHQAVPRTSTAVRAGCSRAVALTPWAIWPSGRRPGPGCPPPTRFVGRSAHPVGDRVHWGARPQSRPGPARRRRISPRRPRRRGRSRSGVRTGRRPDRTRPGPRCGCRSRRRGTRPVRC